MEFLLSQASLLTFLHECVPFSRDPRLHPYRTDDCGGDPYRFNVREHSCGLMVMPRPVSCQGSSRGPLYR